MLKNRWIARRCGVTVPSMKGLPTHERMHQAVTERDPDFDGVFYTCVKTTGIFCRPTCTARTPLARNVEFVGSVQEAMLAGYRACKVCRPSEPSGGHPAWVERLLEQVEQRGSAGVSVRLRDEELRSMDIDPGAARRYFHKRFGMTFQAYQRARRLGRAFASLRAGTGELRAGMDHGWSSSSAFRDAFKVQFGAPPGRARKGGAEMMIAQWIETPLKPMVAIASDRGLVLLEFTDRRGLEAELELVRRVHGAAVTPGSNEHTERTARELGEYFAGGRKTFGVPLDLRGSEFQLAVWDRLRKIPHGAVASYGEMARDLGKPGAARAIGRANGENRVAIIVPCHRVIQSDGSLCGYGGGVWRKRWLLEHEGVRVKGESGAAKGGVRQLELAGIEESDE